MDFSSAFAFVLIAGLSTGLGGALTFIVRKEDEKFLPISVGFAAGIMVFLALTEFLAESKESLYEVIGRYGEVTAATCFLAGIFIVAIIDFLFPHNSSERISANRGNEELSRTGLVTALAVSLHNIPEGIAMVFLIMHDPASAIPLLVAVVAHNIPAGIAVALPVYYASLSKRKALVYSVLTGLTQPLSALAGYLFLASHLNSVAFGCLYAVAAGVIVFIAIDDLLPTAFRHGKRHHVTYSFVLGMIVMAFCFLVFSH